MEESERRLLRETVREGVEEALRLYGFDTSDTPSMQADMIYLRKARLGADEVFKWMRRATLTVAVSSLLLALWQGIKFYVRMD
jgi:hypothetical protein